MYYVYILKSIKKDKIYIGSTNDIVRRLKEHNEGNDFFTKIYKPWELIYYEAFNIEKMARMREKKLKQHGNAIRELKKRIGLQSGAGFTLVELLVVIAIIGILSTVAVVNLNSARTKAKVSAALALAKSYESPAVFCDSQDGQIISPSPSGTYTGGGTAFCTKDIGVNWPLAQDLPEDYEVIGSSDVSPGEGIWYFAIFDSNYILPMIICTNSTGCYSQ